MERLRNVEEERNILRNELECERLQWQDKLEREQQEHAVHLSKLRETDQNLVKERELSKKLQESIELLQMQVEAAAKAQEVAMERAQEAAAFEASQRKAVVERQSIWDWIKCPARSPPGEAKPKVPLADADSEDQASVQAIMWQVLSAIRGVTA